MSQPILEQSNSSESASLASNWQLFPPPLRTIDQHRAFWDSVEKCALEFNELAASAAAEHERDRAIEKLGIGIFDAFGALWGVDYTWLQLVLQYVTRFNSQREASGKGEGNPPSGKEDAAGNEDRSFSNIGDEEL
ncbi:hypothetical protein FVEG_15993 [Fusarium verticillioides 7600]|uniref:Uncharacterized protein n=1 Tax=Gibberella moniliformis (strain M3125 / FGSC 7600) TaxID=334819 RepID=W7MG97_GIBM7|nr:hypothetical protein FVEG_15993 [Fusarium verticillioides 7600]EWG46570.1 hypothetical protein FVEG_15993 [Fusarium verticillioides 7600]